MSGYIYRSAVWNMLGRIDWFLLLIFVFAVAGCQGDSERPISLSEQAYSFQPYSALQMTDTLASIQPLAYFTRTISVEQRFPPVAWQQAQFEELASTIAADEIALGAKLLSMTWKTDCSEVDFGPQKFLTTYARHGLAQAPGSRLLNARIETTVWIAPREGRIEMGMTGYSPPLDLSREPTNNSNPVLPAETLLALAEKSGGQKFRESLSDNCEIWGTLGDVYYDSVDNKKSLHLIFDVKTGELVKTQLFPTVTP